jgi:hypothetical protein
MVACQTSELLANPGKECSARPSCGASYRCPNLGLKLPRRGHFFATPSAKKRRWLGHAAGLLLMLLATACATPPAPQVATPPPPGQARIWFYRLWDPSESLNAANIDVNGVYFGSVEPGSAFYRDVPSGVYQIAPQNKYLDYNQNTNVAVVPGQQVFIAVVDLSSWANPLNRQISIHAERVECPHKTQNIRVLLDRSPVEPGDFVAQPIGRFTFTFTPTHSRSDPVSVGLRIAAVKRVPGGSASKTFS